MFPFWKRPLFYTKKCFLSNYLKGNTFTNFLQKQQRTAVFI
nr:MAG TPA: hypothetical protein [Caudoviricetes sp.]